MIDTLPRDLGQVTSSGRIIGSSIVGFDWRYDAITSQTGQPTLAQARASKGGALVRINVPPQYPMRRISWAVNSGGTSSSPTVDIKFFRMGKEVASIRQPYNRFDGNYTAHVPFVAAPTDIAGECKTSFAFTLAGAAVKAGNATHGFKVFTEIDEIAIIEFSPMVFSASPSNSDYIYIACLSSPQ